MHTGQAASAHGAVCPVYCIIAKLSPSAAPLDIPAVPFQGAFVIFCIGHQTVVV